MRAFHVIRIPDGAFTAFRSSPPNERGDLVRWSVSNSERNPQKAMRRFGISHRGVELRLCPSRYCSRPAPSDLPPPISDDDGSGKGASECLQCQFSLDNTA